MSVAAPGWRLRLRRPRLSLRSIPRAGWLCALVAVLNGIAWSVLVPPLQSFDETVHVYYSQFLAETANVPRPVEGSVLSEDEIAVVYGVRLFDVVGNTDARPPWSQPLEDRLDRTLARGPGRVSQGADGGVGSYPPAYYALGAIAYRLTPSDSILDRMAAMRLVSALLAGLTALFVFLFIRELLPGKAWAWTVGGMVAALQPLFGFMSGVFNPDNGLATASAALFFLIARAFRTGLTPRLAVGIGLATALGFLAKLAMLGLIPGAALAVVLLARRARSVRLALIAAGAAAAPVLLYCAINVMIWSRPLLPSATGGAPPVASRNFKQMLNYVWQSYFPKLGFMEDTAPDYPIWDRYFTSWVGRFGWGDYGFPRWVSSVTLIVLVALLAGAVALAVRHRAAMRARAGEWLTYAALALGLLGLLGYTGYGYWRDTAGNGFEQGRYLLPLLALYGGLVAAGVRGLGDRWGRPAGALLVVAALSCSVWAQLLTIARWYG